MRLALHRTGGPGYRGIGFIDIVAGLASNVVGGIFGADSERRQLNAQKEMMAMQTLAQERIARMNMEAADRQTEAALRTAEIQSANERIAIESAYATQESIARMQQRVAQEGLATQLVSGSQEGIFGLAREGLSQSGQVARAFPRAGTTAATVMVVGTVVALAWMMKKPAKKKTRRRKRKPAPAPVVSEEPTL
jgi:hypothetical protein